MPKARSGTFDLYYEEAGSGSSAPPVLLIHGSAGDHRRMAPQLEALRPSRRVVSVDLRGHGQSDAPASSEYSIEEFARDLEKFCDTLQLQRPVVVGHSLGGEVAMELALGRLKPAAIVAIDAPVFFPPEFRAGMGDLRADLAGPGFSEVLRGFMSQAFFRPYSDPALREEIIEATLAFPKERYLKLWDACTRYDASRFARELRCPALYLHSVVPSDLEAFRRACPALHTGQVVGAGHYPQLETSDQVNSMLLWFLDCVVPRAC